MARPRIPPHKEDVILTILHQLLLKDPRSITKITTLAGLSHDSLLQWFRRNRNPSLRSIEKVLNVLGYELEIMKKG